MTTHGIHHVTMICHDAQENVDFFVGRLGMRRVKTAVNFDDPTAYHLYYGDPVASPGTLVTYFPYPDGRRAIPGAGTTTALILAIPRGSYDFWKTRLTEAEEVVRFGERGLKIADPDGLEVVLTEIDRDPNPEDPNWRHPEIPADKAVLGFHAVVLQEGDRHHTEPLLVDAMGYRQIAEENGTTRYQVADGIGGFLDVIYDVPHRHHGGAGGVHHVAFRVTDDEEQLEWLKWLRDRGFNASPQMERNYFRSIYFRERGGVLFELATDGPGMGIDEPAETLGQGLMLPDWYEPQREAIVAALPPLRDPVESVRA